MYNIAIIGTGNVAYHMAEMITRNPNCSLSCIVEHTLGNAIHIPKQQSTITLTLTPDIAHSIPKCHFYIICVSDTHIASTFQLLQGVDGIILHTSGATPLIPPSSEHHAGVGVIYPCQTFTRDVAMDYSSINWLIEGENESVQNQILLLAQTLPNNSISIANSSMRAKVHLAAVWVSNFLNRMIVEGQNILNSAGLQPSILNTLIQQTVTKALLGNATSAQTGPAIRGDINTMNKHLDILQKLPDAEQLTKLYKLISNRINPTI